MDYVLENVYKSIWETLGFTTKYGQKQTEHDKDKCTDNDNQYQVYASSFNFWNAFNQNNNQNTQ